MGSWLGHFSLSLSIYIFIFLSCLLILMNNNTNKERKRERKSNHLIMSERESCHFTWLMKSCFPNPQHHHPQPLHRPPDPPPTPTTTTTISSLPDDLLLECLSRVSSSSLPSVSLVCRRWSRLLSSSALYHLRRRNASFSHTLFAFSVSDSALFAASLPSAHPYSWTTSFLPLPLHGFQGPLSHSRISAIGRGIYIIGRRDMVRYDAWTGAVTARAAMIFPRKKFAASMVSGRIYVAGGAARTSALEEYDPLINRWSVVAEAPRRRYGCIGAAVDGVVYVIGGLKVGASDTEIVPLAAGAEAHVYASSMDLYDVEARGWLRSRAVPSGGCVVAACAAAGFVYVLTSHAVELSFWRFDARRKSSDGGGGGGGFGEWCRMKSPPLPAQVRLDSSVRFSCVGVGDAVALIQVTGSIDDLLRRSGRSTRGLKEGLVLIYDTAAGEWSRGADLPEVIRRAACVCVEC